MLAQQRPNGLPPAVTGDDDGGLVPGERPVAITTPTKPASNTMAAVAARDASRLADGHLVFDAMYR